jgi:hypothetical protein
MDVKEPASKPALKEAGVLTRPASRVAISILSTVEICVLIAVRNKKTKSASMVVAVVMEQRIVVKAFGAM